MSDSKPAKKTKKKRHDEKKEKKCTCGKNKNKRFSAQQVILHYFPNEEGKSPTRQQVVDFLVNDFKDIEAYRVAQDDDKISCYARFVKRVNVRDGGSFFEMEDFGLEFQTVKTHAHRKLVEAFCKKDSELLSFGEMKWTCNPALPPRLEDDE